MCPYTVMLHGREKIHPHRCHGAREQLPTNDDELGDNECVNLDDDEPFVVNDLTDSDQETSKLDSDIDDHMNEVRFVYNIIIEFFKCTESA